MNKNILLFLLFAIIIGNVYSAGFCFIAPNGVDTVNCSSSKPCQTITQCLSNLINESDITITITSGLYNNNCGVQLINSSITSLNLQAPDQRPNAVTFDCAGSNEPHLIFEGAGLAVVMNNINFTNGNNMNNGGCISANNIKSLQVQDVTMTNCRSLATGGAIYSNGSLTMISTSSFSNNNAVNGGALFVNAALNGSSISYVSISGNTAQNGAGVYINGDYLSFTYSHIFENVASVYGGGLYITSPTPSNTNGNYDFINSTFSNNTAILGGGLYASNLNHSWNIFGALFVNNSATYWNVTDVNVECGLSTSEFCYACLTQDCQTHCGPSNLQSCSSNSTQALCYGNIKFKTCTTGNCACTPKGMSTTGKVLIAVISLCLLAGVILITVDVIRYLVNKRKNKSYTPIA